MLPNDVFVNVRGTAPEGVAANTRRMTFAANIPFFVVSAILLFTGQLLQLALISAATPRDLASMALSFFLSSVALAMIPLLICGVLSGVGRGYLPAAIWMAALSLSTIYFWEHFSYQWLALHLSDSVPLLIQNVFADFQVMRSKMLALVAVLCAYAVFFVAGTIVGCRCFRRYPSFHRTVSMRMTIAIFAAALCGYFGEQAASPFTMTAKALEQRSDAVWQITLREPSAVSAGQHPLYTLPVVNFRQRPTSEQLDIVLSQVTPSAVERDSNIFLFVVDSLRADAINPETTPNLWRFKQQAFAPQIGIAAANCTHISWYSLLNATNPMYWSVIAHQAHSDGAVPLRALKRAGYTIHAISTPALDYFGFAHSIFGDNLKLAASVADQAAVLNGRSDQDVGDLDELVMKRLDVDIDQLQSTSRAFYLVMLDAPHHDYTWARDYKPRFEPFMAKVPLLSTRITPANVGLLKSRYDDAVNFDDELFGRFVTKLEQRRLLDSSIVVVTGDHGEEFLENGHLVHSSAFDGYQLRVPIIMHLPEGLSRGVDVNLASHDSVFPTIFDALGLARVNSVLDGKSMLHGSSDAVAFSAMCASASPSKLLVDGGSEKVELQFVGAAKMGTRVVARKMFATEVYDRDYREESTQAARGPALELVRRGLNEIVLAGGK